MSRIARLSRGNAFPLRLRSKQSLMRSSMISTVALRVRYCGKPRVDTDIRHSVGLEPVAQVAAHAAQLGADVLR